MSYGLPSKGQHDWDDELNNSIESLRADVQDAVSKATSAQSNANDARNIVQSAGDINTARSDALNAATSANTSANTATGAATTATSAATSAQTAKTAAEAARDAAQAVGTTNDTVIASRINDSTSATRAALNLSFGRLSGVQAVATANGALAPMKHNPVDATSGNLTMTLADATDAGQMVVVSKKDSSANTVTVSVAHLRDGGAGSIVLVGQYETITFTSKADGTWWPVGDHRTKAYFDATYSGRAVPANITPVPQGPWDATRSLYNATPSTLRRIRGRLAESRISGKRLVKVLAIGDSLTAAEGAGSPRNIASYPAAFRDALVAAGCRMAGDGWVTPNAYEQTTATKPSQWVATVGAWPNFSGYGHLSNFVGSQTANDKIKFTSTLPGDTLQFTFLHNTPAFHYSIDGGAEIARPYAGSSPVTYDTITVTGLDPALTHSVEIRVDSGATSQVFIGPARVYNSTAKGLLLANFGVGGSPSSSWLSTATSFYNGPTTLALNPDVDLLLIEPMIFNDINASVSTATHKANIKAIIANYTAQASNPNVIIVIPGYGSTNTSTFDGFRKVNYEIADELGIPLVDMSQRLGSYAGANADGLYSDTVHLTSAGYGDMGRAVAAAVLG